MSIEYVKFQRGSQSAYDALKTAGRIDKNTLYFIRSEGESGVGRLYMGQYCISGGDVVLESAFLNDLHDVDVANAELNSFLVRGEDGKWIAKTLADVTDMVLADGFNPDGAFPLDKRSYFESYAEAEAAAKTAGTESSVYYFGQTVCVVENGVASLYIINTDGSLGEVGGKIDVDENAFELVDGVLNLLGFADAVAGAQLLKGSDGKLSWVKPDNTTVEGLELTVAGLVKDIEDIQKALVSEDEDGNPTGIVKDIQDLEDTVGAEAVYDEEGNLVEEATGIFKDIEDIEDKIGDPANSELGEEASGLYALLDEKANSAEVEEALNKKANIADVYSKEDADIAIAFAINNAAHLKREIFNSFAEAETAMATYGLAADQYIYMVARSNGAIDGNHYDEYMAFKLGEAWVLERVGDWGVDLSAYAKTADVNNALEEKVDKKTSIVVDENGEEKEVDWTLLSPEDQAKLASLVIGDNGVEISGKVNADNVEGLGSWISKNKDSVDGLMSIEDEVKLAGIESGAQVNFVKSVDTEQFNVNDAGKLTLLNIDQSKIIDLADTLNGKVDKVEGYHLMAEAESVKLAGIADGAEVNVINAVSEDFSIGENRTLILNNISASKIVDLESLLNAKANKTDLDALDERVDALEGYMTWTEMTV